MKEVLCHVLYGFGQCILGCPGRLRVGNKLRSTFVTSHRSLQNNNAPSYVRSNAHAHISGFGGGWGKIQILRIMKDSRIGTYALVCAHV